MQCRMPPPLNDNQLSDALDGSAAPDVLAHLALCPHCAARLEAARVFEQNLKETLYRWDCPSPDLLAEYTSGRLAAGDASAIAAHLAGCVRCSHELEDFQQFLLADALPALQPPAPSAARRHGGTSARIMPHQGAVLRGAGPEPIMAEADGVTIFVDLQPRPDGRAALQGQLIANDQEVWEGALVEIRQAGTLTATAIVDDLGSFACDALPAGTLDLRITAPGGRMVVLAGVAAAL